MTRAPTNQKSKAEQGPNPIKPEVNATKPVATQQRLRFRRENLKSSYCNMCNATSTREEVVLNFGVNQNWDQPTTRPQELEVDLQHRVVLSPFAAKRLSQALAQLIDDYEQRYGKLS